MKLTKVLLCLLALSLALRLHAQNYVYATGVPTFATTFPVDHGIINVNNGDIHLEIPLATNQQRGSLTLQEKLVYDSRIWKILQTGSAYSWQPTNVPGGMGGWSFSSGLGTGNLSYYQSNGSVSCAAGVGTQPYNVFWGFVWTDPQGTTHSFPNTRTIQYTQSDSDKCPNPPAGSPTTTQTAPDGSGYVIQVSNYTQAAVFDQQGAQYNAGVGVSPLTQDANGNHWTQDGSGNLVDTLGHTPILKSTSGNKIYYDVLAVNGTRQRYTITTETVNFNTAFGQSAVSDTPGSFTAIQSIGLPDGTQYSFTYDGGTASGDYGELQTMTLPQGGTISLTYTNFVDSFQNSNRWIKTYNYSGNTTTFAPSTISKCSSSAGCQEKMVVTDPANNDSVYTFSLDKTGITNGSSWVAAIDRYSGSSQSGGTKLISQASSYTYAQTSYSISGPNGSVVYSGTYQTPTSTTTSSTLQDVGLTTQTVTAFGAALGKPTSVKIWDFFSGTPPSTATVDTENTYGSSVNGAPILTQTIVTDAAGNQVNKTTFVPDTHGNITARHDWINSANATFDTSATYDSAGTMLSSTTPSGTTNYGHDSTDTFTTSTTPPTSVSGVSLGTAAVYDVSTGVVTSQTDENGQTTSYSSFDPLNRPQIISHPDGGQDYFGFGATYLAHDHNIDSSNARTSSRTVYDSFGRVINQLTANGQSQGYRADTCYDILDRVSFVSLPYADGGGSNRCSGAGDSTQYDALSRVIRVTHADGTSRSYTYRGRATQVVDENGVTTIQQRDVLGRLIGVCEISSNGNMPGSGSPQTCGLDIAGMGFLTSYTYNLGAHTTTIAQSGQGGPSGQSRAFITDWIGRTLSVQEPEQFTGNANTLTTYSYSYTSGSELTITRTKPLQNQTNLNSTTTKVSTYDVLGRLRYVHYTDGVTPDAEYIYDVADSGEGTAQTMLKGRLSFGNTSNAKTDYSYDAVGNVQKMWECEPNGCGKSGWTRELDFVYDYAGRMTQEVDPAAGSINYSYSPANEITGITNSAYHDAYNPGTLVSSVTNGPFGPTGYVLGNGLGENITYDSSGRVANKYLCKGGVTAYYCNTGSNQVWGMASTWSGNQLSASIDTAQNVGGNYAYDEFGRLKSFNSTAGVATTFNWTYDRWGNRWSQTPGDSVTFNTGTNRVVDSSVVYDAAGNLMKDSHHSYTYDQEGNLLQVDAGQTASYIYDAFNQRVHINVPNASPNTLEFTYDYAGRRITTWDATVNFGIRGQIWFGNTPVAYRGSQGHTYFEQSDWQGTQRVLTDYAGNVLSFYRSNPFGDGYTATGQDDNLFHYAETEHDAESGTDHAQSRQYNTNIGNWMSLDPYAGSYAWDNPQSFNRYAYVGNDPVSLSDPSGQCFECAVLITCATDPACIAATAGAILADKLLFSFFFPAPSFHGTLKPRPSGPFDDHLGLPNGKLPNPGIAGALGLPDNGCEFGACGPGASSFQASAATIGGTLVCQFLEPCGAIEDSLLVLSTVGVIGTNIYMGRKQTNEKVDEAKRVAPLDPCGYLKGQLAGASTINKLKIKQALKYLGCANSGKDRGGPNK